MTEMTKKERVMATVKGQPVDRVPVRFFGHNNCQVERDPNTLAALLLAQIRWYDWDFVKIQSRCYYLGEAWGCKYRWRFACDRPEELEDYVIKSADDFGKLRRLDPTQGPFGEHVEVARLLHEALPDSVPYVHSTLNPLTAAAWLAGGFHVSWTDTASEVNRIKQFMKESPEKLHHGLSVIAHTMADHARAMIRAGADGIFLSTMAWASRDTLTDKEYEIFSKPYDLMVLEAAVQEGATLNILHICKENMMFELLTDFPVQVINWDAASPRNPSLKEVLSKTDKAVWGGVDQKVSLLEGPIDAITRDVHMALEETGGRRFILGPGCAIQPQTPEAHLIAAKEALSTWQKG